MPPDQVVLSINGHDFDKETISEQSSQYGYHVEQLADVYNTVITRELLIQEARRRKIDQEESFRQALKKYYENSLISILLERRNSEIQVSVSEDEIDKFLGLSGKTVIFTRLEKVPAPSEDISQLGGLTTTALFDDLAMPIQQLLWSINVGEIGVKFDTGNEELAIRFDDISDYTTESSGPPPRSRVRSILLDFKKEQELNRWLTDLKTKANIKIHDDRQQ